MRDLEAGLEAGLEGLRTPGCLQLFRCVDKSGSGVRDRYCKQNRHGQVYPSCGIFLRVRMVTQDLWVKGAAHGRLRHLLHNVWKLCLGLLACIAIGAQQAWRRDRNVLRQLINSHNIILSKLYQPCPRLSAYEHRFFASSQSGAWNSSFPWTKLLVSVDCAHDAS